jgi:hypothetical protein
VSKSFKSLIDVMYGASGMAIFCPRWVMCGMALSFGSGGLGGSVGTPGGVATGLGAGPMLGPAFGAPAPEAAPLPTMTTATPAAAIAPTTATRRLRILEFWLTDIGSCLVFWFGSPMVNECRHFQ